jgi:hypothetical protein
LQHNKGWRDAIQLLGVGIDLPIAAIYGGVDVS